MRARRPAGGRARARRRALPGTDAGRQESRSRRNPLRGHRQARVSAGVRSAPDAMVREVIGAVLRRLMPADDEPRAATPATRRARAAGATPRAPAPTRSRIPARPRPHRPLDRLPAPGLQDPGVPQPRGRPVPHPPDAFARGRAARRVRSRGRCGSTKTWSRRSRWRTTWATRPSAMPDRTRSTTAWQAHGGFEHNLQSLRVVDELEQRYPQLRRPEPELRDPRGHPQALLARQCRAHRGGGARRRGAALPATAPSPSLEAQLCNLADEIAYNAHDIDDGVRSGLITHRAAGRGRRCSIATGARRLAEYPGAGRAGGCCTKRSAAC